MVRRAARTSPRDERGTMGYYDTAQICTNGHVISQFAANSKHAQKYCEKCGAATIMVCPGCSKPIRGGYHSDGIVIGISRYDLPAYCILCGMPFPWTETRVAVAKQFASELTALTQHETPTLASPI